MRRAAFSIVWRVFVVLITAGVALAQSEATVVVNGQTGKAPVIRQNGSTFVDVAALAQIANGSLSFKGNAIALSLPGASGDVSAAGEATKVADNTSLSRDYMKAAFEEIALLREWGAAVGYAIQNGYPIQEAWAANYRGKAQSGLQLASAAATTNGDKSAQQLLSNEFDGVRQWSDRLVQESQNMETAKYSMSPDSLRQEPQTQKLIACWHALGSMLGSGSFQDDDSCH